MTTPSGWRRAPLGSLGSWSGGGTPSKDEPSFWDRGSIPWVSPKDMKVFNIHDSEDHITPAALEGSATKLLQPGSVLIVTRSGILEHTLPVAVASTAVTVNQDLKAICPAEGIQPEFVAWALRAFGRDILRRCKKDGTTVASIEFAALKGFEIPIAPPAEQGRVVEAIESLLSRLDAAGASFERIRTKLKAYRASVLKAAVEGRLVPTEADLAKKEGREYEPAPVLLDRILRERQRRWEEIELDRLKKAHKPPKDDTWKRRYAAPAFPNTKELPALPEGWCWATVDQVGDVLLGRQRAPQYLKGTNPTPYLRVANVKDDALDFSDLEEMDFDATHLEKYRLLPEDILVSEGQSPHLVGQSAIYKGGFTDLCFQKTLHRFRAIPGGPSSAYAQVVFRAHVRTGVFAAVASITTNIAHLTLEKFKSSRFPLAPLPEQARIEAESERILSIIDALATEAERGEQRVVRLRQAVLRWAFEGRLVDQDPGDEPAEVLLARIRTTRASASQTAHSRRKTKKAS